MTIPTSTSEEIEPLSQVIVFPRGQLRPADRKRLQKLGLVAVEAEDPSAVRLMVPTHNALRGDDLLCAALQAITTHKPFTSDGAPLVLFAKDLIKRVLDRNTEKP